MSISHHLITISLRAQSSILYATTTEGIWTSLYAMVSSKDDQIIADSFSLFYMRCYPYHTVTDLTISEFNALIAPIVNVQKENLLILFAASMIP